MIRFANPALLQLLWLCPLAFAAALFLERRARARLLTSFGKNATALSVGVSARRRKLKAGCGALAFAFFALALARPQSGKSLEKIKSEGVELMLVVDVSNSMLAEDVKPSRLEHAKAEMIRLLDLLSGDKVGIVAFAGSATLVSPLTTDKSGLKMFVESLSPQSVETQGTEIAKALREARGAFDRGGEDAEAGSKVTRVILVASDGEDQEKGALEEAKKLADEGVRVFAAAYGTERGAPIPQRDERGFMAGYKRDRSGQTIQTLVKGEFLRSLADAGRGSFYHVTFGGQEAKAIRADIDKLEKSQFDSEVTAAYDERFQIPLALALFFLLLDLAVGERGGVAMRWRGRFSTRASSVAAALALAGSLLSGTEANASDLSAALKNNEGVRRFSEGKAGEAFKRFSEAVGDAPGESRVHANLGAAFYANKELERALEEFSVASRLAKTNVDKFAGAFGAGVAAGELKRIDEALDWYQKALSIDPGNVETKTNIELLIQSAQGEGKGEGEKKDGKPDENKDGKGDQPKPNPQSGQKPKPTPKPFESKDISQQDVQKILEELKQQEEQIRAKYQREGAKDAPRAKDW